MMKYFSILCLFLGLGCSTQEKAIQTSQDIKSLYQHFREKGGTTYFKNCELGFGNEIERQVLANILKIDTTALASENLTVHRKGAFILEQDTNQLYFVYAVAKNDRIKELNIRSIKNEAVTDEVTLIKFENKKLHYDYFVEEYHSRIQVVAKKEDKSLQYIFYNIENGAFKQINFPEKDDFFRERSYDFYKNGHIVFYNDFKTKELVLPSGKRGKLIGKVVKQYGGKEVGFHDIVKLEPNDLVKEPYLTFKHNNYYHHYPKELYLLKSDQLKKEEGTVSYEISLPAKQKKLLIEDAFLHYLE